MSDEKNLPAIPEGDFATGFEGMENQDFSFPFLVICQANSPYLNPTHELYIENARQSQIINTMNMTACNEVHVIPCKYAFRFVEWKPRGQGGGFAGSYHREDCPEDLTTDPLTGRTIRKNGNEIMGTGYYLCLLQEENFDKIIIPMASTQLKKSRHWNSKMMAIKSEGKVMPIFNKLYKLSTVGESNSKGNWYGWKIEIADDRTVYQLSADLFETAKLVATSSENFLPEQIIKAIGDKTEESF